MARYRARLDELTPLVAARPRTATGTALAEPPREQAASELTPRQLEVLQLVADGLSNQEIAQRLWLGEETIRSHIKGALVALGAGSRAHAITIGFRQGFLS